MRIVLVMLGLLAASGCTHQRLTCNTARTASTVMQIEYQVILDNLALMACNASHLPSHIRVKEGTVQVNDEYGIRRLAIPIGTGTAFEGPHAISSLTEQWSADPVNDPGDVKLLQDVYRRVLGLSADPDPRFLRQARASRVSESQDEGTQNGGSRESDNGGQQESGDMSAASHPKFAFAARHRSHTASSPNGAEENEAASGNQEGNSRDEGSRNHNDQKNGESDSDPSEHGEEKEEELPAPRDLDESASPVAQLDDEIPRNWFSIGTRKEVPREACYVGCYRDTYVWVMPDGVDGLSRFTLVILSITKLRPGAAPTGAGGIVFTR